MIGCRDLSFSFVCLLTYMSAFGIAETGCCLAVEDEDDNPVDKIIGGIRKGTAIPFRALMRRSCCSQNVYKAMCRSKAVPM